MPTVEDAQVRAEFQLELDEVARHIKTAVAELSSPLRDLVEFQLDFLDTLPRAAVTLAAAYTTPDSAEKRGRRVALAAAQEMLYLALRVHHQLMTAPAQSHAPTDGGSTSAANAPLDDDGNKSLLGSTILAGDYCFSRAAQFAAQTGNPKVVAIFAHSLQQISEGRLRQLFGRDDEEFDEHAELIRSGATAASELASHSPEVRHVIDGLVSFITHPHTRHPGDASTPPVQRLLAEDAIMEQRTRWELVLDGSRPAS